MNNSDKKKVLGVIAMNVLEILSVILIIAPIILLFKAIFTAGDSTNIISLIKAIFRDIFILACGIALLTLCLRIEKMKELKRQTELKKKELEEKKAKKESAKASGGTTMGLGALAGLFGGMGMPGTMGNMPPMTDENGNHIIEGEAKPVEESPHVVEEGSVVDAKPEQEGTYINSIDELKDLINSDDPKAQEILRQVQENLNKSK